MCLESTLLTKAGLPTAAWLKVSVTIIFTALRVIPMPVAVEKVVEYTGGCGISAGSANLQNGGISYDTEIHHKDVLSTPDNGITEL